MPCVCVSVCPQSQAFAVYAIASYLNSPPSGPSRRLLQTVDLTSLTTLQSIVQSTANAMQSAGALSLDPPTDPAVISAAAAALQNMITVINGLTDPTQLIQSAYVADSALTDALTDLITGAITPADFVTATGTGALLQAVLTTQIPGQIVPNPCATVTQPMWTSACLSPDPFSCTSGGAPLNPIAECVNPPNWDIRQRRLDFAYKWDLVGTGFSGTGACCVVLSCMHALHANTHAKCLCIPNTHTARMQCTYSAHAEHMLPCTCSGILSHHLCVPCTS